MKYIFLLSLTLLITLNKIASVFVFLQEQIHWIYFVCIVNINASFGPFIDVSVLHLILFKWHSDYLLHVLELIIAVANAMAFDMSLMFICEGEKTPRCSWSHVWNTPNGLR